MEKYNKTYRKKKSAYIREADIEFASENTTSEIKRNVDVVTMIMKMMRMMKMKQSLKRTYN
ncbi:MAG: hypothetical protein WDZ40_00255 [Candidatus Spechtbacterales bacterium]